MIRGYVNDHGRLRRVDPIEDYTEVIWFDLVAPTRDEEQTVESVLNIDVPSREDMQEIEASSRLYYENDAAFMTAMLPARADDDYPQMAPVAFVLAGTQLVTVREHDPRAFQTFPSRAGKIVLGCTSGEAVLVALLEDTVDRLADILERAAREVDRLSRSIFHGRSRGPVKSRDLQSVIDEIGSKGDLTSNMRDSLLSLDRLFGFLSHAARLRKSDRDIRARVKTLARDTHSLIDHAGFLSQKITFLLDATLGMINIEQNAIIKIFSVAAVVFLPPTLIASIYGMNFAYMPELDMRFGYPLALSLMVGSAILPYWLFKRRGWL